MNRQAYPVLAAAVLAFALLTACGDGGVTEPDVNPGLLDESSSLGLASSGELPQGSAPFTGPDGLQMDATAEEFIQQLSFSDGRVWKTSGVSIRAVPDEAVAGAPVERLRFASAATGTLASVGPGTYPLLSEWPAIDFITRIDLAIASITRPGAPRESLRASGGTMTITSLNYFDDVYTCSLPNVTSIRVTECTYKLGVVRGSIQFRVPLPGGGEIVQQQEEFTLPIMRRTIIMEWNDG